MTADEIRIAIAEACGWERSSGPSGHTEWRCQHLLGWRDNPLDYPNDFNAMHEAEKWIKPQQWRVYSDKLMGAVRDADLTLNGSNIEARYKSAHATAHQRCEAFLRTIGKWKE